METVEAPLTEVTAKLLSYVEATEGFVVKEAPLVAQEILNRAYFTGVYYLVVGLLLILGGVLALKYARRLWDLGVEAENIGFLLLCTTTAGWIGGTLMVVYNLYNLIYVYVCPRLVIISFLKEVM